MIHYYFHKHKRLIKVFSITILIIVCLIPVFVSSLSAAADDQYTLTADYMCWFNNNTTTPSDWTSYSNMLTHSNEISLNTSYYNTSYVFFSLNGTGLNSFSFVPSDFLSGSSGNIYVCFYLGYVIDDTIYRFPTSVTNVGFGETFSISDLNIPAEADKFIISIKATNRVYRSYPVISFVPVVPPAPPAPSEWDYFYEFINGLIGGVVLTFTSLFSLPSKILWAIIFGVPIINYLLDFFDNLLESMFPEATDLHELRPNGYTPPNYYDNHPFENYSRWFYEHNGGFHW